MFQRLLATLVTAAALGAGPATADAPASSLRPVARVSAETATLVKPAARPEQPSAQPLISTSEQTGDAAKPARRGLFSVLRPKPRSGKVQAFAGKKRRELLRGAVCGDTALQGEPVGRVPGRVSGCGVEDAIRLRSVSGIALSQQSVMDCTTAKALKSWVDKGLTPAVGRRGGGVAQIKVAAHYACRTRNSQKGARISEHGRGRAIDIAAFTLADGTEVSVLKDWGKGWQGKALKNAHAQACGPFGTVLGPNADRHHRDHFHLDTARYRSGSYCK